MIAKFRSKKLKIVLAALVVMLAGMHFGAAGVLADTGLNYRLKWLFNVSVVGDLYADVFQIFKGRGLEVTVKAGGPERDAIKELELGHAQFGVASADQVIRARSKGAPVVVIAQLFQVNPLQWIYRSADLRISEIADLKGKILGVTFGGNDETILRTLLAKGRVREGDVTLFSVRYDYTPFYKRKVDIWPVYRNAQGPILSEKLRKAGETVAFFNPAEHGVRFVANSVVTSERMLRNRPEVVRQFAQALLQGWTEALDPENHAKAIRMLREFDRDTPKHILEEQLNITRGLIQPSPDFKIGTIDVAGWRQTEKIMRDQNQIPASVALEDILEPSYASF